MLTQKCHRNLLNITMTLRSDSNAVKKYAILETTVLPLAHYQVLKAVLNKGRSKRGVRDFGTHGLGDEVCRGRRRGGTKASLCLVLQLV